MNLSILISCLPENNSLFYSIFCFVVVEFLRESGGLIHISDHTYRLTNVYFFDPNWICQILYAVVNRRGSSHSVNKKELRNLVSQFGFNDSQFEDFLQLLGRFEIVLKAGEDR